MEIRKNNYEKGYWNQIKTHHPHSFSTLVVCPLIVLQINFQEVNLTTVFQNHFNIFYFHHLQVIRIPETTDETFDALFQFSKELGKVPVSCKVSNELNTNVLH